MAKRKIDISQKQIADFCRRWQIDKLALFGSSLRDDFGPESDVDILVTFAPGAKWGLLDHVEMEQTLSRLLGHKVDLFTRRAVELSPNWILRKEILDTAEVIYGAG
ncbi:MAG: nucleotidyltransferase family protein [Desulfobacterales bacterium]